MRYAELRQKLNERKKPKAYITKEKPKFKKLDFVVVKARDDKYWNLRGMVTKVINRKGYHHLYHVRFSEDTPSFPYLEMDLRKAFFQGTKV